MPEHDRTDTALDPVKVVAYFDTATAPEGTVGSESFWAAPLPDHAATTGTHLAARVDNLLVWAPFTLGDIVLVTPNDDERLQVIALLARTNCTSLGALVDYPDDDPAREAAAGILAGQISTACYERGARTERFGATVVCIQLPDSVPADDDAVDEWLKGTFGHLVEQSDLDVSLSVTHGPGDPLVIDWLDTSLAQALPDETYTGPADQAWDGALDPAFAAAVAQARAEGHIPGWMSTQHLTACASELWLRDGRVRAAITAGRYRGVAIFAFRVSAPPGTALPPLDGPLI